MIGHNDATPPALQTMPVSEPISTAAWLRLRDLFEAACALPASEHAEFVNVRASDSAELAQSLTRMLAAHALHAGQTDQAQAQVLGQVDVLQVEAHHHTEMDSGATLGAFSLISEIGRGGMGVVWKAKRNDDVAQTVAIKLLPPHRWDAQSRARFQAERDALASLEHPGIARLIDVGTYASVGQSDSFGLNVTPRRDSRGEAGKIDSLGKNVLPRQDSAPFYVMEYVEGASITDYANQHGLSTHERVRLFTQVLDAVDYAHRQLLIHRDLKPSNILVNATGQVKLIDFGIAKNLSGVAAQTQTQQRFFSPSFAAPEQLRGLANSVAVDVYQLGAVLYELLSGRPIFDFSDASAVEVERSITERVPPAPSRAAQSEKNARPRSSLDADLDAICLHCLRKEPGQRYASVAALHEDIRRTLAHRGIAIRQGQGWYRAAKFLRRNALSVGFALTVLGLVAGFGWTSWRQAQAVERERDVAVVERRNAQETVEFLISTFRSVDTFGGSDAPTTLTDYVRNSIVLLNAESAMDLAQRARLKLALAYAAQNNAELTSEFNELLSSVQQFAESTSNSNVLAEALLLEAASRASPMESWETLQKLLKLTLTDDVIKVRVDLAIIRHKSSNWLLKSDVHTPLLELKNILARNVKLAKSNRYIFGEYVFAMIKLLERTTTPDKSIAELEDLLSQHKTEFLRNTLEDAAVHESLSQLYSDVGKYDIALTRMQHSREINLKVLGAEHPQFAKDLNSIGKIYLFSGALTKSAAAFREAIAHAEKFGEQRLDAIAAISHNLAQVCRLQNDHRCAEAALARAVANGEKVWASNNPNLAIFRMEYGKHWLESEPVRAFQLFALARLALPDAPELKLYAALEQLRLGNVRSAKALALQSCAAGADVENEPEKVLAISELLKSLGPLDCFKHG
jgi:serine/threonine protein kinase